MKLNEIASLSELEPRVLMSTVTGTISAADISVPETNGTTTAAFVVRLDSAQSTDTLVSYSTKNGTGKAKKDYTATKGTVTIPAGSTEATVDVPVLGNTTYNGDRTFQLVLKPKTKGIAVSNKGVATATIVEDDAVPTVTIGDATVIEGNKGKTKLTLPVDLSGVTTKGAVITYQTADVTATSGQDYKAAHGTIKFKPGQTHSTIKLQVNGDTTAEPDEVFNVNIATATGATPSPAFSRVVIQDDDGGVTRPTVTVSDASAVTAGDDSQFSVQVLGSALTVPISFRYSTSLLSGSDAATASQFVAQNGVVTIPAGSTTATITVPTVNGTVTGSPVKFQLNLSTPANAVLATTTATGNIVAPSGPDSGDVVPSFITNDATSNEGNPNNPKSLTFQIQLSAASSVPVTVQYETVYDANDGDPDHAVPGVDYTPVSGTLTFAPGVTSLNASVPIIPNTVKNDFVRHVTLQISNATNATITADNTALGNILDDDQ